MLITPRCCTFVEDNQEGVASCQCDSNRAGNRWTWLFSAAQGSRDRKEWELPVSQSMVSTGLMQRSSSMSLCHTRVFATTSQGRLAASRCPLDGLFTLLDARRTTERLNGRWGACAALCPAPCSCSTHTVRLRNCSVAILQQLPLMYPPKRTSSTNNE